MDRRFAHFSAKIQDVPSDKLADLSGYRGTLSECIEHLPIKVESDVMAEHQIDDPMFDYKLYRFGRSRQIFRGPQPDLRRAYISYIGGSSTFGRYNDEPFPDQVEHALGVRSFNLGTDGAGPGFFLGDPEVLRAASDAQVCVIQIMCASALSNRMFTVRPRRNMRLHAVSDLMIGIYPEVEFGRFSFVQAMLKHLQALDESRFKLVVNEMKNAWIGRMQTLINSVETQTVLLWFSQREPDTSHSKSGGAQYYPHFVDRAMIDAVAPAADDYVECATSEGLPHNLQVDGKTILFRPSGEPIVENREFPSPDMHKRAAEALIPALKPFL
ncbi:MAG: DUF6473 family protein [Pseudomonadota bacterium]